MARGNSSISSSNEKVAVVLKDDQKTMKTKSDILTSSKGRVDKALVERAVQALLKYHDDQKTSSDKKNQLLGNDCNLQVQFRLVVGPQRPSIKPIPIALPHAICKMVSGGDSKEENDNNNNDNNDDDGLDEAEVCFIVKEDAKPWIQEMIITFPQYMGNVKKVLGLESLRKKHSSPTQRRDLANKYTLFLCDDRILPNMTKALGKEFVKQKKMPIPIDMRRKHAIPLSIYKALQCTFMYLRDTATCITIVAGTTGMPAHKLVDNVISICELAVLKIPRQWANIQSIALTTPECTHGLPIYNKIPAELQEISRMAGLEPIWKSPTDIDNDDNDDGDEEKKKKQEGQRIKRKQQELAVAKSPLVRALKQQKKQKKMETKQLAAEPDSKQEAEEKAKATTTTDKESTAKTNKKEPGSRDDDVNEKKNTKDATPKSKTTDHADKTTTTNNAISTTKSSKKKDKEAVTKSSTENQSKATDNDNQAVPTPQRTTTPRGEEDDESKLSKKKKSNKKETKEEKTSSSSSSKKRKNSMDKNDDKDKDEASSPEEKSRTISGGAGEKSDAFNKPFHASQKFIGSKKGYVYRTGPQGLGYYVDVKPVVDKQAIAALLRMGAAKQQQQHGSGGKKSSSSGKNKRHSGGRGGGGGRSGGRRR